MTINTPATHTDKSDTTALLRDADAIMKIARLTELLEGAPPEPATGQNPESQTPSRRSRGAQRKYGQYTAHGLACTFYEVVASGQSVTYAEIAKTIWFRYTDEELAIIGLDHVRDTERRSGMTRPETADDWRATTAGIRLFKAELQRLWDQFQTLFAPMDDTPIKANYSKHDRPTKAAVKEAAADQALAAKTALKSQVVNAIVAASIQHEHNKRYPGKPIHEGLLIDHEGHLAVDETHLVTGIGYLPPDAAPGNLMARSHAHSRVYKYSPAMIGLSLAVAVARPTQTHAIPDLILGATIHRPTGGLSDAIPEMVDAIEHNGLRRTRRSNANQYIVVDGGYTGPTLNRDVHARGYGLVHKYATTRERLYPIGSTRNANGVLVPGPYLFNGKVLCPGASSKQLELINLDVPRKKNPKVKSRKNDRSKNPAAEPTKKNEKAAKKHNPNEHPDAGRDRYTGTDGVYDGYELQVQQGVEARLDAMTMPTSGRPRQTVARKRGGQSKNGPPPEIVMEVSVTCPARAGKARCPMFGLGHMSDPDLLHLHAIPDPPGLTEPDERPACCSNATGEMRIRIPEHPFKLWQDFMPGTWTHEDWYTGPRADSERANSILKGKSGSTSLERGTVAPRKAAPFALAIAAAIATTNRITVESWYQRIALAAGNKPEPIGHANKRQRAQALANYQAARRTTKRAG